MECTPVCASAWRVSQWPSLTRKLDPWSPVLSSSKKNICSGPQWNQLQSQWSAWVAITLTVTETWALLKGLQFACKAKQHRSVWEEGGRRVLKYEAQGSWDGWDQFSSMPLAGVQFPKRPGAVIWPVQNEVFWLQVCFQENWAAESNWEETLVLTFSWGLGMPGHIKECDT